MESNTREPWFETDEIQDLVETLEQFERTAKAFEGNQESLKWLVLAAHNAVQSACVCSLTYQHSNQTGALEATLRRDWLEWFEQARRSSGEQPPAQKLASFDDL